MRSWRWVAAGSVLGVAAMALYTFLTPPRWMARAELLIPYDESATARLALPTLAQQADPLSVLRGIVLSRASMVRVSEATGLTVRELRDRLDVQVSPEDNQLLLACAHTDKALAEEVVRQAIRSLAYLARANTVSVSSRQARYLEETIVRRKADLEAAQRDLAEYVRDSRTVLEPSSPLANAEYVRRYRDARLELAKVERQIEAERASASRLGSPTLETPSGIPEIEAWRAKAAQAEYDLKVARSQYGEEAPAVVRARQALDAARQSLRQEVSRYVQSVDQGITKQVADLIGQKAVLQWQVETLGKLAEATPEEAVEFSRKLQRVQELSSALGFLQEQYEQAKAKAEVERVRWSLLTPPYVEEKPVNKSYTRNGLIGLLLGGFAGLVASSRRRSAEA
ncbi:MAG: hypothetical protein N2109_03880 [Fimbriimonadales bacterium]|nr:hypothetical protein [Fimbriimonadales bacterium]